MQEFFGQLIICMICFLGFVGFLLKRTDKEGQIKKRAGQAAIRGGISLFKHLTK
jgi:hypothetical protein